MVAFINQRCGTFRKLDGTLTPEAGIIKDFEVVAKQVLLSKSPKQEAFGASIKEMKDKFPGLYSFCCMLTHAHARE
jgi:hypothetical protein